MPRSSHWRSSFSVYTFTLRRVSVILPPTPQPPLRLARAGGAGGCRGAGPPWAEGIGQEGGGGRSPSRARARHASSSRSPSALRRDPHPRRGRRAQGWRGARRREELPGHGRTKGGQEAAAEGGAPEEARRPGRCGAAGRGARLYCAAAAQARSPSLAARLPVTPWVRPSARGAAEPPSCPARLCPRPAGAAGPAAG